jgi:hypothetical protein
MKSQINKIINKVFRKTIYYKHLSNSDIRIERCFSLREGLYYSVSAPNYSSNSGSLKRALRTALEYHIYNKWKYERRWDEVLESLQKPSWPMVKIYKVQTNERAS